MTSEQEQVQELAAAVLFMMMKQMIDSGVPHLKALRAASVELLQGTYGSAVWKELGMNTRTVERWRAELREALAQAPGIADAPPPAVLESWVRLSTKKAG
jgi:aminoglycoside phosphotransferase (APT) family kinase protein